jgi:regulator of RNase E activity RraA
VGNILSGWTDFLTTDGEKEWRQREAEFENDIKTRDELLAKWNEGWECLFQAICLLNEDDLEKEIFIRNPLNCFRNKLPDLSLNVFTTQYSGWQLFPCIVKEIQIFCLAMTNLNQVLEQLRQFDTPTVCNVIELFDIRPRTEGYMDRSIMSCFPEMSPMVGFAATATFRSSKPTDEPSYGSLEKQVESFQELPGPAVVVFEDLDKPVVAATFGEIMCTSYQKFGAAGLITSGAGRDLDQVRMLDFPVFTNGTVCSHGYSRIPSVNIPVEVGGVTINPGELVHGDCNGVTTIPMEIAEAVSILCEQYMSAEAVILNYLKSDKVTSAGLGQAIRECKTTLQQMANKLQP